jgi:hypothetical protein
MLPHWIGIPGVIVLIGLIAYGVRQGTKIRSRSEGSSSDPGFSPPSDSDTPSHGW